MTKTVKDCFVISPIGEDGSDIRKRADQILKHVIGPAADECSFSAIRADKISEPGLITSQVIQHIIYDPLVIADLTGMNPNVFYELAIRHAFKKPLVQIVQKGDKIPFDVAGMRTISVDHRDLDSVDEARKEIVKQIRAVEGKQPDEIESPISVSVELQSLRTSDNPEQRTLADFLAVVSELRSDIASVEKKLSNPEALLPPGYIREICEIPNMRKNRKMVMLMEEIERIMLMIDKGMVKKGPEYSELYDRLLRLMLIARNEY